MSTNGYLLRLFTINSGLASVVSKIIICKLLSKFTTLQYKVKPSSPLLS
ncbi:hypothetical protein HMPREF2531_00103 [Bacteroides intestinalis]|uniref:Uncharacterized protein n=2 Tax=Bacteroides TaxID=816 RepID=A0A139LVI5_9BACE|nr:hypothetical protein BACCELL_00573 [Bacteroides cellulosilyticus DSM 14838]KXT55464.1 hypothetical protein HMPREF2531_00103 [Bacteroides intestinalis]